MLTIRARLLEKIFLAKLFWSGCLVAVAALVVAVGLASSLRDRQPTVALQFMPNDARAAARRADEIAFGDNGSRASIDRAVTFARAALARDVLLPSAWRTLSLTEPDGSAQSVRLLEMAEHVSRRDAPTQLALLEMRVNQGDIARALDHYDLILRVSTAYDALLFPILTSAMTDPEIRPVFAKRLSAAETWRRRFLSYVVNADTPYDAQLGLFSAMAKTAPLSDRDIVSAQATNSILTGQYAIGERLYQLVEPTNVGKALRNGGFEDDGGVPPFNWMLDIDGAIAVSVNASEAGRRLELVSERGDSARAARQFLHLPPGRHRIRADTGAITGFFAGTSYISISCAAPVKPIVSLDGAAGKQLRGEFTVPSDCGWQWLDVGLRQTVDGGRGAVWIDQFVID